MCEPGVVLGLTAGALFGISAIGYRGATLEVASDSALLRATVALAAVTLFQSLRWRCWLAWREPGEVMRVARAWRSTAAGRADGAAWVAGLVRGLSLMNAAYVRSLGQMELIFSLAASVLFFRERVRGARGWRASPCWRRASSAW